MDISEKRRECFECRLKFVHNKDEYFFVFEVMKLALATVLVRYSFVAKSPSCNEIGRFSFPIFVFSSTFFNCIVSFVYIGTSRSPAVCSPFKAMNM